MIKIGILGTSDVAFRRFLPALAKNTNFKYIGIASRNIKKTQPFINEYGGKAFDGYESIIQSDEVDAVYIPLPPSLHFEWAMKALENGKHIFLEKPSVTEFTDSQKLVAKAKEKNLALHENYMFQYHSQLGYVLSLIESKVIGKLRLIRCAFGFPMRSEGDFRYIKELGGGSLLDCGGYTVKLANLLLGDTCQVVQANLSFEDCDVDLYGNATLKNDEGLVAQISFGMDNSYKCELELWGSLGLLSTPRIFTCPSDCEPEITVEVKGKKETYAIPKDDQFFNSINYFHSCILDAAIRKQNYSALLKQSELIENIMIFSSNSRL